MTKGQIDKNGNYLFGYTSGKDTVVMVQYSPSGKYFQFAFLSSAVGSVLVDLRVPLNEDNPTMKLNTSVSYEGYPIEGYTTAQASQFHFDDSNRTMDFTVTKGNAYDSTQQEVLNMCSKSAFTYWNLLLYVYADAGKMSSIGFTGMDTFFFKDGDKMAYGSMVFDIDKEGKSAGIIAEYRDYTRGNGYKAVTRNFDPSTYVNRRTKLYFSISNNTTNFYDYEESDFTSKSIVPNCLEDVNMVLNKYGFTLQDLGFKEFVPWK